MRQEAQFHNAAGLGGVTALSTGAQYIAYYRLPPGILFAGAGPGTGFAGAASAGRGGGGASSRSVIAGSAAFAAAG